MIQQTTLQFLEDLGKNNQKEWFHNHKSAYQSARTNFLEVIQDLIQGISTFDEGVANSHLKASRCMMRINRDIRFSKDKTPYKTNFFAYINPGGRKSPSGGYYFSLSPENSFLGGGIYMPDAATLTQIRNAIANDFQSWQNILGESSFTSVFGEVKAPEKLKHAPKGFDPDHPAITYLRFKGYYTQKMLDPQAVLAGNFPAEALQHFQTARPMVAFLNKAIG